MPQIICPECKGARIIQEQIRTRCLTCMNVSPHANFCSICRGTRFIVDTEYKICGQCCGGKKIMNY